MLVFHPKAVNDWQFCSHNNRLLNLVDHINDRAPSLVFTMILKFSGVIPALEKKATLGSEVK